MKNIILFVSVLSLYSFSAFSDETRNAQQSTPQINENSINNKLASLTGMTNLGNTYKFSVVYTYTIADNKVTGVFVMSTNADKNNLKNIAKIISKKGMACRVVQNFKDVNVNINNLIIEVTNPYTAYVYTSNYELNSCFLPYKEGFMGNFK